MPATPEIALVNEHCSYFGAFCKGEGGQIYGTKGTLLGHQEANDTRSDSKWVLSGQHVNLKDSFATSGFIKVCSLLSTIKSRVWISYFILGELLFQNLYWAF